MNFFIEDEKKLFIIKTIGIIVGIIILFSLIFYFTIPFRSDLSRKRDLLNFYNHKGFHNISEETIEEYKFYNSLIEEDYNINIDPVISDYLNKVELSAKKALFGSYSKDNILKSDRYYKDKALDYGYIDDDYTKIYESVAEYIRENDIENYYDCISLVFSTLETICEHKGNNIFRGWSTNKTKLESVISGQNGIYEISLPFDTILVIKVPLSEKLNNKFKDLKIYQTLKEGEYDIELITDKGNTIKSQLTMNNSNKEYSHTRDMTVNINGILFNYEKGEVSILRNGEY